MRVLRLRWLALVCVAVLLSTGAPTGATAQTCAFKVDGISALPDGVLLRVMRCLVDELNRTKRANKALEDRVAALEALMTELPATYVNEDGVVTEEEGRTIGRASFVLSARSTGGANALPIEQRVLEEVCGQTGGCSVSVAFRQISLLNSEPKDSVLTGPCAFTYDPESGNWTRGAGCGGAPTAGTDGDQSASGADQVDPVIVASSGACLLSESEPGRAVGQDVGFLRDHNRGLFLIAIPARQPNGIRRFQCELVLN